MCRSWLGPVLTCTDMQLLYTAGLDSLMMNWLNTIGMQIFAPVAIVGLAACEFLVPLCILQHKFFAAMSAVLEKQCKVQRVFLFKMAENKQFLSSMQCYRSILLEIAFSHN